MACPYFLPTERCDDAGWLRPARLPLGGGWRGVCTAPGCEAAVPSDSELKEFCNLGYARGCARFPASAAADAVRFSVARDLGDRIELCYVCELAHAPREYGTLEYDPESRAWRRAHPDPRIHKMAACYLESYLPRRQTAAAPTCKSE